MRILRWAFRNVLSTGYAGGAETWRIHPPKANWGRAPKAHRRPKGPLHSLKSLFWIGFGLWMVFGGGLHLFGEFMRWLTSALTNLPAGGIQ